MSLTEKGRFCQNCQKQVLDLTNMSNEDIYQLFKNKEGKICGRISEKQLLTNFQSAQPNYFQKWRKALYLLPLMIGVGKMAAQNQGDTLNKPFFEQRVNFQKNQGEKKDQKPEKNRLIANRSFIAGYIYDEQNQGILGVSVSVNGTDVSTLSNILGHYYLSLPTFHNENKEIILEFSKDGYKTQKINISQLTTDTLDVYLSYVGLDMHLRNTSLAITLQGKIGGVVCQPPLHKRIWRGITSPFRKKKYK